MHTYQMYQAVPGNRNNITIDSIDLILKSLLYMKANLF